MLYVVQVDQKSLRARSDPMPAAIALKVAKAWQSHGDRGVQIVEAVSNGLEPRFWTIRDFIAFSKQSSSRKLRDTSAQEITPASQVEVANPG